jgi:hypothetical protein
MGTPLESQQWMAGDLTHLVDHSWLPNDALLDFLPSPLGEMEGDDGMHVFLQDASNELYALHTEEDVMGLPSAASVDTPTAQQRRSSDQQPHTQRSRLAASKAAQQEAAAKPATRRRAPSQAQREAHKRHRLRKRAQARPWRAPASRCLRTATIASTPARAHATPALLEPLPTTPRFNCSLARPTSPRTRPVPDTLRCPALSPAHR